LIEHEKSAKPLAAVAVFPPVQLSDAPEVPVPLVIARITEEVESDDSRCPSESSIATSTENFVPAIAGEGGCTLKTNWLGDPTGTWGFETTNERVAWLLLGAVITAVNCCGFSDVDVATLHEGKNPDAELFKY
jgi:hypothetical protein